MSKDRLLRQWLPTGISLNPVGRNAEEIWIEEFSEIYPRFFDSVMEIQKADISSLKGFGELTEDNQPEYASFHEFITGTFADDREDYWKNWRELFDTSKMTRDFFETYYEKMLSYSRYCEGQRFLTNNNLFFGNMVIMSSAVGFMDWSRAAVADWLLDFACMDLHRPYFQIPEKLVPYLQGKGKLPKNFRERFLCMAYYKGLDGLRWHASIQDDESCRTIMESISNLEKRIWNLQVNP